MQNRIKPFVKWAGGKGSLLNQLNNYYPLELKNGEIECYIEPFIGGGAVLIDILQNYKVKEAYAFDINLDLINSYNIIKNNVEELIFNLKLLEKEYLSLEKDDRKEYFYNIRKQYNSYRLTKNEMSLQKATEFIFLNRTCFNGLYRVNKNGDFNVPMGNYKNPTICDEDNLKALSELIKNVNFEYGDYKTSQKYIKKNTFVYFDPPYRPLNVTSGFTSYTKEDFDDENQKELALYYKELNDNNVKVMLSNSNPKNTNKEDCFFENIYKGFNINEVYAKRMINANSNGRGEISELLITNYESDNHYYGEIECIEGNTILKQIILN
jgi:DNA adenine methylase